VWSSSLRKRSRPTLPAGTAFPRFAMARTGAYIRHMPRKSIELPPAIARAFVRDMRAFPPEKNAIKRDEIAARQLHALKQHYTGKLRLFDAKEMSLQMKDQV
jgi:hypothetical protein